MENFVYTNIGNREVNEDYAGKSVVNTNEGFFIVCDGLGGHGRGEVASQLIVENMIENVKKSEINAEELLEKSILASHDVLLKEQEKEKANNEMKTTIVCLRIFDGKAQWAHVGDTRLYMFRKKKQLIRTLDHSVPQMLVAAGEIKEKDIRHHEDRNRLIRVMGTPWDNPKYDVSEPIEVEKGDAFLLCTDGFWELITEREMIKCLKKAKSPEEWVLKMSELVNKHGAKKDMDNNTAIGVII